MFVCNYVFYINVEFTACVRLSLVLIHYYTKPVNQLIFFCFLLPLTSVPTSNCTVPVDHFNLLLLHKRRKYCLTNDLNSSVWSLQPVSGSSMFKWILIQAGSVISKLWIEGWAAHGPSLVCHQKSLRISDGRKNRKASPNLCADLRWSQSKLPAWSGVDFFFLKKAPSLKKTHSHPSA